MAEAKTTLEGVPETNFIDKYAWEYNGNTITCKQVLFVSHGVSETYTTTTTTSNLNVDGTVKTTTTKRIIKHNEVVENILNFTETYTYTNGFLIQHYK